MSGHRIELYAPGKAWDGLRLAVETAPFLFPVPPPPPQIRPEGVEVALGIKVLEYWPTTGVTADGFEIWAERIWKERAR